MAKRGCILKTIRSSAHLVRSRKSKDIKKKITPSERIVKDNEEEEGE